MDDIITSRLCTNCGTSPQSTDGQCDCGERHKYDWIDNNGKTVLLDRFNEMIKARIEENKTKEEKTK
jgi:hypothetical protein